MARRLHVRGKAVVYASLAEDDLDLRPLAKARALVANGEDQLNALLAVSARELGFDRSSLRAWRLCESHHHRALSTVS